MITTAYDMLYSNEFFIPYCYSSCLQIYCNLLVQSQAASAAITTTIPITAIVVNTAAARQQRMDHSSLWYWHENAPRSSLFEQGLVTMSMNMLCSSLNQQIMLPPQSSHNGGTEKKTCICFKYQKYTNFEIPDAVITFSALKFITWSTTRHMNIFSITTTDVHCGCREQW